MAENFDPYLQWLGIRDPERPPNYYRLLGVELLESDPDVLTNAVDRQMAHVRNFQAGQYSAASQQILNELAAAKLCLLSAERKTQYDAQLQAQQAATQQTVDSTSMQQPSEGGVGKSPAAGLWALTPRTTPTADHPQQGEAGPAADAENSPLTAIVIAVLVALVLILAGLIVVKVTSNRGNDDPDDPGIAGDPDGGTLPAPEEKPEPKPQPKPEPKPDPKPKPKPQPKPKPDPKPKSKPEPKMKPEIPTPPAAESIQSALAALAERDVEVARRHLALAEKAAEGQSEEARRVGRLQALLGHLETFTGAVGRGIARLKPGQRLAVDGKRIAVVEVAGSEVVLEAGGQRQRFTPKTLPMGLALAIAGPEPSPSAMLSRATALVFDPRGNLDLAARLCQQAEERGQSTAELAEELALARAARGVPEPKPEPPKPIRRPVPDPAGQTAALKVVKEVFEKEFAKAQKPREKAKLAENLLRQGEDTKDDATARYVLLIEARKLAVEVGDRELLVKSQEALAKWYDVDPREMVTRTLIGAAKTSRTSAANKALAEEAVAQTEIAIRQNRFQAALELAQAAIDMARKSGDRVLLKRAVGKKREAEELQQRYKTFVAAEQILADNPDNADANLVCGRHYCFVKNDWTAGLPMLGKGSDPALRAVAEAEIAAVGNPGREVALGNGWWDASEATDDPLQQTQCRGRAGHWYGLALPHLTGLTRTKIQRRLDQIKR